MSLRYLKTALIGFVALLGLLYGLQNVVNHDAAYQSVAYAAGMDEHVVYPGSLGPAFESPALIWTFLTLIVLGELSVAVTAGKGAWNLWSARAAPAAEFNAAKDLGMLGCGLALLVWFGLFTVLGGAYFQMWQTTAGALSLEGAFQLVGSVGLVALFVNMPDS